MKQLIPIALYCMTLVACADVPPPAAPAPVSTQVHFYPTAGQSSEQQSRDRYDCYLWAVKQSGFDPGRARQQISVVPMPPKGTNTAVGAVAGAAVGAAVASPHSTGEGAILGAVAGAVLGAAADASRAAEAQQVQQRYDRRDSAEADSYRRAMSACLSGRGYSVE